MRHVCLLLACGATFVGCLGVPPVGEMKPPLSRVVDENGHEIGFIEDSPTREPRGVDFDFAAAGRSVDGDKGER